MCHVITSCRTKCYALLHVGMSMTLNSKAAEESLELSISRKHLECLGSKCCCRHVWREGKKTVHVLKSWCDALYNSVQTTAEFHIFQLTGWRQRKSWSVSFSRHLSVWRVWRAFWGFRHLLCFLRVWSAKRNQSDHNPTHTGGFIEADFFNNQISINWFILTSFNTN